MKIEEINIDGFGKFHKYHCQTSGKLEVFYGKNESGKTTLRKFMIAMLFGLEKSRGLAARYDDFTRYQPVNGGIYGGSMIFEKDGIRYKIMRTPINRPPATMAGIIGTKISLNNFTNL